MLVENFERTPKSYEDRVLWTWLKMFTTPKSYQFCNDKLSSVIFVLAITGTLNGTTKASFEADDPNRQKNRVFNP